MEERTIQQLTALLNSMFQKESLRKNVYLFNSLTPQMELSIRTVAKERRIAQITSDISLIITALRQCPYVKVITTSLIEVMMKGDELVVKLTSLQNAKIQKRDLQNIAKGMKCDYKDEKSHFLVEFQSHAAAVEFIERLKNEKKKYSIELIQKNPYKCLEDSIINLRKERKEEKKHQTEFESVQSYVSSYPYFDYNQLNYQFPVFVRRAVDSDSQNQKQRAVIDVNRKYVEKQKIIQKLETRVRLNSEDFPEVGSRLKQKKNQQVE